MRGILGDKHTKQAASTRRVYQYISDDGVVFWSFTKLPHRVTPPKRLTLLSRVGKHLINYLTELRRTAEEFDRYDDDLEQP